MDLLPPAVDFGHVHRRFADAGPIAAPASVVRSLVALALVVDGEVYTLVPGPAEYSLEAGDDDAEVVVELTEYAWRCLYGELRTIPGLLYANGLRVVRGDTAAVLAWDPVIRSLYGGRPLYDPESPVLSADGEPLDLDAAFPVDAPDDAIATFLQSAGYAHVRAVFSPQEMDGLRREVDRLAALARPDDGVSWWAPTADGEPTLCRLTYAGLRSDPICALAEDPHVERLASLSGVPLRPVIDRMDGHQVVIKRPGAGGGLADLPWHVDCGLGMHDVLCPSVLIGIQLEDASSSSGQLHLLAGSHRGVGAPPAPGDDPARYPVARLSTQAGDCTVHFGDIMHSAPPPRGDAGRRTLYIQFYNPAVFDVIGAGEGTNDLLARDSAGLVLAPVEVQ